MAYKRLKTEDMDVNFKFACRCCLKSETELLKLDVLTESSLDDSDASSTKVPLIRFLLFCMRTENMPELPQVICIECSKSLKIAYFFIQNSLKAHEILCRKLCPGKAKPSVRFNCQQQQQTQSISDVSSASICYCCLVYAFVIVCRDLRETTRQLAQVTVQSNRGLVCNMDAKSAALSSTIVWSSSSTYVCMQVMKMSQTLAQTAGNFNSTSFIYFSRKQSNHGIHANCAAM